MSRFPTLGFSFILLVVSRKIARCKHSVCPGRMVSKMLSRMSMQSSSSLSIYMNVGNKVYRDAFQRSDVLCLFRSRHKRHPLSQYGLWNRCIY